MPFLKAFLLIRQAPGQWSLEVHRELETLEETWRELQEQGTPTGCLHVGFEPISSSDVEALASEHLGRLLMTASARYALVGYGDWPAYPVADIAGQPIFVTSGRWAEQPGGSSFPSNRLQSPDPAAVAPAEYPGMPKTDMAGNWLVVLNEAQPGLAQAAAEAGIIDEATYQDGEAALSPDLRADLGIARLRLLLGTNGYDDLPMVARMCPPWMAGQPLERIGLTVRAFNVFHRENLATVADLGRLSSGELLNLRGLGRGSVEDSVRAILRAMGATPADGDGGKGADMWGCCRPGGPQAESNTSAEVPEADPASMIEALEQTCRRVGEREGAILGRRMGLHGPAERLQAIADTMNLTRERVRQLESRAIRMVTKRMTWPQVLQAKVSAMRAAVGRPIAVLELAELDAWFQGSETMAEPIDYCFEQFLQRAYSVVTIQGRAYVLPVSQREWNDAVSRGKALLADAVGDQVTRAEARKRIEGLLAESAADLRDVLWEAVTGLAHFAADDGEEPRLVGYGRGAEQWVELVLTESASPLHYTQIAVLASQRAGRAFDERRIHAAANEVGYLFARGTYGLRKHLPMTNDDVERLVADVEEIIMRGEPGRQWTCAELCLTLYGLGMALDDQLTPNMLNAALRIGSRSLTNHGRMVWSLGQEGNNAMAQRIELRNSVIAILRQTGRPMSYAEIRQAVLRTRGVAGTFQIHGKDPIIRMASGYWGLIDRDVPLSPAEQQAIVDDLERVLAKRQTGLHVSELKTSLQETSRLAERIEDPALLLALAQRSRRMRVTHGDYLYLPAWDGPRRPTPVDAVRTALQAAGTEGLPAAEIVRCASAILGRDLLRDRIYGPLDSLQATWNEASGHWQLPELAGSAVETDTVTGDSRSEPSQDAPQNRPF